MIRKLYIVFFITILISSCSPDIDLTASYKDITVVYGILNPADTVHYIRIEKAFLGNIRAEQMAQYPDSIYYDTEDLEVHIQKINNNDSVEFDYNLSPVTNISKDTGFFTNKNHIVYAFNEPNLDINKKYKLKIINTKTKKTITGETEIVQDFNMTGQFMLQYYTVKLANDLGEYQDLKLTWKSAKNGIRYQIKVQFNYFEITSNNDTISKNVSWLIGEKRASTSMGGESLDLIMSGEQFFQKIAELVKKPASASLVFDRNTALTFIFNVAGVDLDIYMSVNEPTFNLSQEKPEYTNLKNALGIFSSRYKKSFTFGLHDKTINELESGQYTGGLAFRELP